ncbi:ABC transporter ATP-binding protein [Roseomonas sp. AR75]|uniref:ABC transporter ATP-binding protein n=1 Tax=Roseomonas sp. AR75 TaxID=2562311 RepID=UPI0010C1559F|nr:ABC transporter ATP-binding protein [Roseomonas sp. AR75]
MTVLLDVAALTKEFPLPGGRVFRAVEDVAFRLGHGEILGLVGESGSGKTTVGRCLLRLTEPTRGQLVFDGTDLMTLPREALRRMRRRIQMVFQDPFASLNPRLTVGRIVAEPMEIHRLHDGRAARQGKVRALLEEVGLPGDAATRYPHQFSGGQRQRIGIARALAAEPDLIVADEPVSALDVSVQAQVLNLLADLQRRRGLAMLFISHDLEVVRHFCDRIVVMYAGRVMEQGPGSVVVGAPVHPYTRALIAAVPRRDPLQRRLHAPIGGEVPNPMSLPEGCVFHTRCPHVVRACLEARPRLEAVGADHLAACSNPAARIALKDMTDAGD